MDKVLRRSASLLRYRPASYPYISGDGFRSISDHVYDETQKCSASDIKQGQIVFLKTDMLDEWFEKIHTNISVRYKLITHNSDRKIGNKELSLIDDKIIYWFAQNVTVKHARIIPIPIGIENIMWFKSGWVLKLYAKKIKKGLAEIKQNKILFGFSVNTNPSVRNLAINSLRSKSCAEEIKTTLRPKKYFKLLVQYKFVASPEGNGTDCHRTWEALVLGVIPIVTRSVCTEYFQSLGLPIHIIDSWDKLELPEKIEFSDNPAIYFDFWKNKILSS